MRWLLAAVCAGACAPKLPPGPVPTEEADAPARLLYLPDADSPNVYIQAIVAAGSSWDDPGREGLAHLTARAMVDAGAGDLSGPELRDALYPTGNQLELVVDKEWVSLRLRCNVDHARLCVDRFADVLTAPRFADNDVIRLRDDAVYAVTDGLLADEEALGEAVFDAVLYEGHPYGHPVEGRAGVLPTLDATDTRRFHQAHYVRESVVAGLAGAADEELRAHFAERLSALPGEPRPDRVDMAPEPVPGGSLTVVQTGTEVTGFHIGHPIETDRNHPDWPALYVAMTAFGAHRQSFGRLFTAIRADRGLNYGAYAYVEPYVQQGWSPPPENGVLRRTNHFYMWLRPTSLANGPFAAKLARDELAELLESGLSDEELVEVRSHLKGAIPLLATDPGRRLAYALDAEISHTPNLLDHIPAHLDELSNDAIREAVRRHVSLDDLVVVAVTGDGEALRQRLLGDEPTPVEYADVTPDDEQAERDDRVAASGMGLDPSRVVILEADGVFR